MNWDYVQGSSSQAAAHQLPWLSAWWWESMTAPAPRPGDPDRDAEHRRDNEGGNFPSTEPPECKPPHPQGKMNRGSYQQRTIEHLAREAQVPVDEVAQLYDDVRAELAAGARITSFLGIFTIRNVRKVLRQRKLRASSLARSMAG